MNEPLTESGLKKTQSRHCAADRRSEEWRSSSFELNAINRANTLNRTVFRLQMSDQSGRGGGGGRGSDALMKRESEFGPGSFRDQQFHQRSEVPSEPLWAETGHVQTV